MCSPGQKFKTKSIFDVFIIALKVKTLRKNGVSVVTAAFFMFNLHVI